MSSATCHSLSTAAPQADSVGELLPTEGTATLSATVAYVPQRAFVISGTVWHLDLRSCPLPPVTPSVQRFLRLTSFDERRQVKDNVLMGRREDASLLARCLDDSEFAHDLTLLPSGIDTTIGEKGTTLSGGQQQRLCIARALYSEAHLLVMDDSLSSVDPIVCNKIWEKAVRAHAKRGGSVVIVLNQLHLLPQCDQVMFLKGNRMAELGPHSQLMTDDGDYCSLVERLGDAGGDAVDDAAPTADDPKKDDPNDPHEKGDRKTDDQQEASTEDVALVAMEPGPEAEKIVKAEELQSGSTNDSFWRYLSLMGYGKLAFYLLSSLFGFGLLAATDLWLVHWIDLMGTDTDTRRKLAAAVTNSSSASGTACTMEVRAITCNDGKTIVEGTRDHSDCSWSFTACPSAAQDQSYAWVYLALGLGHSLSIVLLSYIAAWCGVSASKNLHAETITRLLQTPLTWFEANPSGRTISRYEYLRIPPAVCEFLT